MRDWTTEELDTIGPAEELQVAALRPDGSLRPYTTIWVVRTGDGLYVRVHRRLRSGARSARLGHPGGSDIWR